jgi:hypothetical protein
MQPEPLEFLGLADCAAIDRRGPLLPLYLVVTIVLHRMVYLASLGLLTLFHLFSLDLPNFRLPFSYF